MGASLAHVRSKDLYRWEHLSPLATLEHFFHTEVPDWFEINGRWYLTFNTLSLGGIQIHTPTRQSVTGTFYLTAERFDGPFSLPADPFLNGAGRGRQSAYSARTIPYGDERIMYCHLNGKLPAWGVPKLLRADAAENLRLEFFPAMQKLETKQICASVADVPLDQRDDLGRWKLEGDHIVGAAAVIASGQRVASDVSDLHVHCSIRGTSAARAGFILRGDPTGQGVGVLLDYEHQRIQIASASGYEVIKNSIGPFASWHCTAFDDCHCELRRDREYHLRCFVRDEFVEVYLDDRWMLTASPLLPPIACEMPVSGRVDLYVERGEAAFSGVRLAAIQPLA
jgi:hypothetical protein